MQNEYYIINRENNNNYPLLLENKGSPSYAAETDFIENPEEIIFCLGDPIPRKPQMVDYHATPYSVISRKIYNILEPKRVKGVQLIPSTVIGKDGELYKDYWYMHIYNIHAVLDRENSIYKWSEIRQVANFIDKLILDNRKLEEIPLEDRLIFRLKERRTFQLFHKSIVDRITAEDVRGVRFITVDDWSTETQFT